MCFDILYSFFLKHFSFLGELSEIWSKVYIGRHVKCPLFLSDFNETWIFSTDFRKILSFQFYWKSMKWEQRCSMRTDGQTDVHDETKTWFSQFFEPHLKVIEIKNFVFNEAYIALWLLWN